MAYSYQEDSVDRKIVVDKEDKMVEVADMKLVVADRMAVVADTKLVVADKQVLAAEQADEQQVADMPKVAVVGLVD